VKEPLSFDRRLGLLKILLDAEPGEGPYLTEKQDSQGTYYRAPPVGYCKRFGLRTKSRQGLRRWVLRPQEWDSTREDLLLLFESVRTGAATADFDCSSAGYIKTPGTSKISLVALTAVGAGEGAALAHRSKVVPSSKLNYAQSAGLGAAGGALGGAVIAGSRRQGRQDLFSKQAYPYLRIL